MLRQTLQSALGANAAAGAAPATLNAAGATVAPTAAGFDVQEIMLPQARLTVAAGSSASAPPATRCRRRR